MSNWLKVVGRALWFVELVFFITVGLGILVTAGYLVVELFGEPLR